MWPGRTPRSVEKGVDGGLALAVPAGELTRQRVEKHKDLLAPVGDLALSRLIPAITEPRGSHVAADFVRLRGWGRLKTDFEFTC